MKSRSFRPFIGLSEMTRLRQKILCKAKGTKKRILTQINADRTRFTQIRLIV